MVRDLMNDRIVVHKKDGTISGVLMAVVSRNLIVTDHNGILIEPDDLVVRKASNGSEETYQVIDPGWHEAFGGIPAGYQMKVRNLAINEAKAAMSSIHININGSNNRFLQNSVDNSVNIHSPTEELIGIYQQLHDAVTALPLKGEEAEDAEDALVAIEQQIHNPKPNKKIIQSMLGLLPHAADVLTLGSALLAAVPSAY